HNHWGHTRFSRTDEIAQKSRQVESGTGQPDLVITLLNEHVKPDLGKTEFDVWIDIDIERLLALHRIEKPGVVRIIGLQLIARRSARGRLGIVEIIVAGKRWHQKIRLIREVEAVTFRLLECQGLGRLVVLVEEPTADELGPGEPQRQRQFPAHWS